MRLALLLLAIPAFAKVNFKKEVKPIIELHCVRCHGEDRAMKNLRLDGRERAMRSIVPGRPDESVFYLAIKTSYMPPGADKVSAGELEILRRWIAEGAKWPKNLVLQPRNPFAK
jgi:mono/diheme cytochrome c family protein